VLHPIIRPQINRQFSVGKDSNLQFQQLHSADVTLMLIHDAAHCVCPWENLVDVLNSKAYERDVVLLHVDRISFTLNNFKGHLVNCFRFIQIVLTNSVNFFFLIKWPGLQRLRPFLSEEVTLQQTRQMEIEIFMMNVLSPDSHQ
jgi:hypothetical protein